MDIDRGALLALFDATRGFMVRSEGERLLWAAELAATQSTSKDMVEVGSYAGKSTILLGAAARAAKGRVFAVDPHEGLTFQNPSGKTESHPPSMEMLTETISKAHLEGTVFPKKMRSYEFTPPGPLGLVFIDAIHYYENVKQDYLHLEPYLEHGGLAVFHDYIDAFHDRDAVERDTALCLPLLRLPATLAFHDYLDPRYPGVTAAVEAFASPRGLRISSVGTMAVVPLTS